MSTDNKPEPVKTVPFREAKVGDFILRMLAGTIPMPLRVTEVTEDRIYCGTRGVGYEFDRNTGVEIDDYISVPVSILK